MIEPRRHSTITPTVVMGCLVVTLPTDLAHELDGLQSLVLEGVRGASVRAAVLDFSSVRVVDCAEFAKVRGVVDMARLMGARVFLVGLRPGVVAYLVDNDADISGLEVERGLEDALERMASSDGGASG